MHPGPALPSAFQSPPVGREPNRRWAASVPLLRRCAASVEELVSLHDVQAYHQTPCQNSRCQFGVLLRWRLLERHRPAGGTAAPAGGPFGQRLDAPSRSPPHRWERAGRTLREDSRKESLLGPCALFWAPGPSRSLSTLADLPVETSSCVRFGGAGLFSRLAPRCLLPSFGRAAAWVRQKGSYLVDPASSHMLVSKIKPCMSKYKLLYTVKLRMAH